MEVGQEEESLLVHPCNEIIEDIEDLISSQDITPKQRYSNRTTIKIKPKKQIKTLRIDMDSPPEKKFVTDNAPATQMIWVKTWGCAHNNSDSEYMAGQLAAYGYTITEKKEDADLWLLNSCTVKNPSEDHFRNEINAAEKQGKHVVLAGCVSQGAPNVAYIQKHSIVGTHQIDRVVEVVEETLKGHQVRLLGTKRFKGQKLGGANLDLPKIRKNPLVEIISINTGCLNQCTYCKTKHARGDLGSYPPDVIVDRAAQAFKEGVVEIWLTSEDTGTYGRDIGYDLPTLLWRIVENIPEGCRLRLGMTNPPYILEHLEEMAKILDHPKVYKFLHVPVQSGSDAVLSDMKREYNVAEFEHVINYLRERIPDMTFATDIICGFPTETEEDFQMTLDLCEKHHFPSLFINQYFPRPGTPAALMQRIPTQQVKQRTKKLTDLFYSYESYTYRIGQVVLVLVTELSNDKQHYVGHTDAYEQVLLPLDNDYMGKLVHVEIIAVTKFSMVGRPLEEGVTPAVAAPYPQGAISGLDPTVSNTGKQTRMIFVLICTLVVIVLRLLLMFYRFMA